MYRDTIFQYVKKQYGTIPEYLWNDLAYYYWNAQNKKMQKCIIVDNIHLCIFGILTFMYSIFRTNMEEYYPI